MLSQFHGHVLFALLATNLCTVSAQIAVYWGQNSAHCTGKGCQERLLHYCQNTPSDIVLLSFLDNYPNTQVNFANQAGDTFPDCDLLHCSQIGRDITACQEMGKKVLLTMGGAIGDYGFVNDASGAAYARTLLDTFGPINPASTVQRPFDDAVVDGFNFDPEHGNASPYTALANELKLLAPEMLLAAAPQCPIPDRVLDHALTNGWFDYIFVQFYNNYCSMDKEFNWKAWSKFAKKKSPNNKVKIFVGLLGSPGGTDQGYVNAATVARHMPELVSDPSFGGFALWDASSAEANHNYARQLQQILEEHSPQRSAMGTSILPSNPSSLTQEFLSQSVTCLPATDSATFSLYASSVSARDSLSTALPAARPAAVAATIYASPQFFQNLVRSVRADMCLSTTEITSSPDKGGTFLCAFAVFVISYELILSQTFQGWRARSQK